MIVHWSVLLLSVTHRWPYSSRFFVCVNLLHVVLGLARDVLEGVRLPNLAQVTASFTNFTIVFTFDVNLATTSKIHGSLTSSVVTLTSVLL